MFFRSVAGGSPLSLPSPVGDRRDHMLCYVCESIHLPGLLNCQETAFALNDHHYNDKIYKYYIIKKKKSYRSDKNITFHSHFVSENRQSLSIFRTLQADDQSKHI